MPEQKQTIMFDAPEAASLRTATGWVTADGRFFGQDENLSRLCSATHRHCKNNPEHPVHEIHGYCDQCHHEKRAKIFAAMPARGWDGDNYFFDTGSLLDYLVDSNITLPDLRLCICEPNMPREIDPSDVFSEDLPGDGEICDDQLVAALDLLNEIIRKLGPLSWSQGKFAVALPKAFLDEIEVKRMKP